MSYHFVCDGGLGSDGPYNFKGTLGRASKDYIPGFQRKEKLNSAEITVNVIDNILKIQKIHQTPLKVNI